MGSPSRWRVELKRVTRAVGVVKTVVRLVEFAHSFSTVFTSNLGVRTLPLLGKPRKQVLATLERLLIELNVKFNLRNKACEASRVVANRMSSVSKFWVGPWMNLFQRPKLRFRPYFTSKILVSLIFTKVKIAFPWFSHEWKCFKLGLFSQKWKCQFQYFHKSENSFPLILTKVKNYIFTKVKDYIFTFHKSENALY